MIESLRAISSLRQAASLSRMCQTRARGYGIVILLLAINASLVNTDTGYEEVVVPSELAAE